MGFGREQSSSSGSSYNWGQSENVAASESVGGSYSGSQQNVWGGQPLGDVYAGAAAGRDQANQLNNAAMPAIGSAVQGLLSPGNSGALSAYGDQVSQIFNEQIMPGINSGAVAAGGVGGSRQGVAQGVAARGAREQIQNFAGQQYNQDQNRIMQMLQSMPGLMQMFQQPSMNFAQQVGGPTVLGSSQAGAFDTSKSSAYGYDQSKGSATNTGMSSGFNVDSGL